jgi:hypothetical protein
MKKGPIKLYESTSVRKWGYHIPAPAAQRSK